MPGNTFRHRWTDAVYASKLTLAQRDTLNAYGRFISRHGVIRVPRKTVADMTRRTNRHIAEHLAAAMAAGLLELVDRSAHDRPAAYRAIIPDTERVPVAGTR